MAVRNRAGLEHSIWSVHLLWEFVLMSSEFWLGVAQTTIGSALGFVLGVAAFHYQQHRQAEQAKIDKTRAALDSLNRLSTAAAASIEALVNFKLQFVSDLAPEVESMKAAVAKIYQLPAGERTKLVPDLKALSEATFHFYVSLPKIAAMPPPTHSEYSLLSKDMPALTLFVHRAVEMMRELNECIESRNSLIAEHAREGGTGDGMTAERIMFYSSMLSGEGEAICLHIDFALDFWRLVLDQVRAYMPVRAKGEHFLDYKLDPKTLSAMPQEMFPKLREQLVTFS